MAGVGSASDRRDRPGDVVAGGGRPTRPPAERSAAGCRDGLAWSNGSGTGPLSLAVLLSGAGRTLENLLRVVAAGELDARIAVVVGSRPEARGLDVAAAAGIPHLVVRRRDFSSDDAYSEAICAALAPYAPDLILLAGFLRRLVVPPALRGRILNIHPALLPNPAAAGRGLYGERVHAAVLAAGATESGATVHVVDDGYDTGPVVLRATVPVLPDDTPATLGARVFAAECDLYPAAIRRYVADHPELFGDRARQDEPLVALGR